VALQLPEGSEGATIERLSRKTGDAPRADPPVAVEHAIDAIRHLLEGERTDLRDITLDLEGETAFHRAVYEQTRAIPAGETKSYGDIARAIGEPHAARAVGQALGANPLPVLVPCHRVLASDGSLHGFSARGGITTKQRLLEIERAQAAGSLRLFE
jgi:methylated-DNA-[protein]-cysteine S-methyltransferase